MLQNSYELHEEIGRGGMAIVYRATRKTDGLEVAVKQMRTDKVEKSQPGKFLLRFKSEAEILQKLVSHKNIVTIHDAEKSFIAMELLRGGTLSDISAECVGQYDRAAQYVLAAAKAVAFAHELGIVHRDLSLRNIMFREGKQSPENLVVTDFGLAVHWQDTLRLTETGEFMGTLDFVSHEQLHDSKHVGEPTDVFSLGVVLFYLCSRVFPFSKTPITTPEQALKSRAKALELSKVCANSRLPPCPIDLASICSRCLVSCENGRIAKMNDLCNELKVFLCPPV